MKTAYRLLIFALVAIVYAIVANIGLSPETAGVSMAVVGLVGSLEIATESDTAGKVIFDSVIEDWNGGAVLNRTRLKADTTEIGAGTLLYIVDGSAEICKTALVITGGNATGIRVNKAHQFIVGEFVLRDVGDAAMPITAIDTTNSSYDVITIGTTLGITPGVGDILIEASAQADDNAVVKYTPNAILLNTTNVEKANPTCSGVVRGSVREDALPYAVPDEYKTAMSLIRFV